MTQRENVETIMGHMIPDYSPDSRHIRRAKAGSVKFEEDLNDPYSDGFTAEMNFHFESIPRLSVQNRRYTYNKSAGENSFLDPRKAKNVYIRLGKRTREIYEADLSKDPDTANKISAFKKALEQEIAAHAGEGGDLLNRDGTFVSKNLEYLVSIGMKFFGVDYFHFEDKNYMFNEEGRRIRPLAHIASTIFNRHSTNRIEGEVFLLEMQRARKITQFLTMLANRAEAYVITNNSKLQISKLPKDDVFTNKYTQYSNNPMEFVENNMKNALSSKFHHGILYNRTAIRKIKNALSLDENMSIRYGDEVLIEARYDGNDYNPHYRYAIPRDSFHSFLPTFNKIRNYLGLTNRAFSDRMMWRLLMYGKNVSSIISQALKEHAQKRTSFKLSDYADYEGGGGLLLSYIANIIYAHMAQITPFVLNMTYSIGARGEKKVYNQNTTIREHVANINSMLTESEGGDRSKKLFISFTNEDGRTVNISGNRNTLLKDLFNQRFLESKLPMLKPIYAYMKSIGITSALSSGNENEYFTSLGIPLPTPAQFYPITEALAAFVASQRGDHAYGTTPMPGGTRRAQAQGKSQLNEVADGAFRRANRIEMFYKVYQTPITWTKKSKWLSYSRIINWG